MARGVDQVLGACEACLVQKHGETFKFSEWRARIKPEDGVGAGEGGNEGEGPDGAGDDYGSDSDDDEVEAPELGVIEEDETAPHRDFVTVGVVGMLLIWLFAFLLSLPLVLSLLPFRFLFCFVLLFPLMPVFCVRVRGFRFWARWYTHACERSLAGTHGRVEATFPPDFHFHGHYL